jgi:hypothetical protein
MPMAGPGCRRSSHRHGTLPPRLVRIPQMSGIFGQLPFADRAARSDRDPGAEHAMNAPFSQHCKNRPDNPQNHLPQTRRD